MRIVIAVMCYGLAVMGSGFATEYYVSLAGSDKNDGLTRESAFRSIQRGVDALEAGDTLTIAPGEYFESVSRRGLGDATEETLIRAAIPGTVLIRGNVPVEDFEPVEGFHYIYGIDFADEVQSVGEADTLTIMEAAGYLAELEFRPGSFYYDAAEGKLYISSSDLQPPKSHRYLASVIPGNGFYLESPTRVTLEGIAVTGFGTREQLPYRDGMGCNWGIQFMEARDCVVRDCVAFLNTGGICTSSGRQGGGNLIVGCTAYGNGSKFSVEGGNIMAFRANGCVIRDSRAWISPTHGIRLYTSTGEGGGRLENLIAWGNQAGDVWIKGVSGETGISRSFTHGKMNVRNVERSIVGGANSYRWGMETPADSISVEEEEELDWNAEFADPENFDFRLQSTSRFRSDDPNQPDRGIAPFCGTVYFVSPEGSDAADGQSLATAWRSLSHALKTIGEGDTLYIEPGRYSADHVISGQSVTIRGRGRGTVVLDGSITLDGVVDGRFERLNFAAPLAIKGGAGVSFANCTVTAAAGIRAQGVDGLRMEHCVLTAPLDAGTSSGLTLAGNRFAARPAVRIDDWTAVNYSNYNSYPGETGVWVVAGKEVALPELQLHGDTYSPVIAAEVHVSGGTVQTDDSLAWKAIGPLGMPIGNYFTREERTIGFGGPFVQSVSTTTANIEWWTTLPARVEFSWGETPECENSAVFNQDQFFSYSLTGLKPATRYYFKIRVLAALPSEVARDWTIVDSATVHSGSLETAATARPPMEWYVATDGDDTADGRSRGTAWRSLNTAAARVAPGDTVWVAGGSYVESVWVRVTGDSDRPITFRGIAGERVEFDGQNRLVYAAFIVNGKHHQVFDYFQSHGLGRPTAHDSAIYPGQLGGMFILHLCSDVSISRALMDGRGAGYSPGFIAAFGSTGIIMDNTVTINAFSSVRFVDTSDVEIRNSVVFRNLIGSVLFEGYRDQKIVIKDSIFTENLPTKVSAAPFSVANADSLYLDNNCFFMRLPAEQRNFVTVYSAAAFDRTRNVYMMPADESVVEFPPPDEVVRMVMADFESAYRPSNSIFANPGFPVLEEVSGTTAAGQPVFPVDRLPAGPVTFSDFFSTNPEVVSRGIGLQPEVFANP